MIEWRYKKQQQNNFPTEIYRLSLVLNLHLLTLDKK